MPSTENTAQLIQSHGREAIRRELQSLQNLTAFIDDQFAAVVALLLEQKGRAIFTGIGKSAIIAQKIVATMNSTGQPALFMHAADAIHGDLGMIQPHDVVIAISKSGNTPEIQSWRRCSSATTTHWWPWWATFKVSWLCKPITFSTPQLTKRHAPTTSPQPRAPRPNY